MRFILFSNSFIVINLAYFGAQIAPDLGSGSPLKLEAWFLSPLQWSSMILFANMTTFYCVTVCCRGTDIGRPDGKLLCSSGGKRGLDWGGDILDGENGWTLEEL